MLNYSSPKHWDSVISNCELVSTRLSDGTCLHTDNSVLVVMSHPQHAGYASDVWRLLSIHWVWIHVVDQPQTWGRSWTSVVLVKGAQRSCSRVGSSILLSQRWWVLAIFGTNDSSCNKFFTCTPLILAPSLKIALQAFKIFFWYICVIINMDSCSNLHVEWGSHIHHIFFLSQAAGT